MSGSDHTVTVSSPFRTVALDLAEGRRDEAWLLRRLEFIDSRLDLADHRLAGIVKLYLSAGELLLPHQRERIEQTFLRFRYHWDEPGDDSMCTWSESHQILFAACEYLIGDALSDRVFANDGRTGAAKRERAASRLRGWMGDRFRYGWSEWLSNTHYEINIVGLSLVVDHAPDPDLARRAAMLLDVLFYDMALHRFDGRFVASAGRAYARQKARPSRAEVNTVLDDAFVAPQPFDPDALAAIFVGRDKYRIPEVLHEVADASGARTVFTSQGVDTQELMADLSHRPDSAADASDAALRMLWAMEAFTTPVGMGPSLDAIHRDGLQANRFLAPLARYSGLRVSRRLGALALRTFNPITQGLCLERANVLTYRTPHYLLTSAQHYHPGEFGDQQHIWQAALPGDISVFATHPGATTLASASRPTTPSAWVGNGIEPDVAQSKNVILALYDTNVRPGYFEGFRHELTHLFFPFARFDQTSLGRTWLAGRRDDSLIGLVSLEPLEMVTEAEVVQRGRVTGWGVVVTDRSQFRSLNHFVEELRQHPLRLRGSTLTWTSPRHKYALTWRGAFRVDEVTVRSEYPRYDTDWSHTPRFPDEIVVRGQNSTLRLNWPMATREERPTP